MPVVVLVLVEAHVGEELAGAVVAERGEGQCVAGLGARAGLDLVGIVHGGRRCVGPPGVRAVLPGRDRPVVVSVVYGRDFRATPAWPRTACAARAAGRGGAQPRRPRAQALGGAPRPRGPPGHRRVRDRPGVPGRHRPHGRRLLRRLPGRPHAGRGGHRRRHRPRHRAVDHRVPGQVPAAGVPPPVPRPGPGPRGAQPPDVRPGAATRR